jgi:hypothetical protein
MKTLLLLITLLTPIAEPEKPRPFDPQTDVWVVAVDEAKELPLRCNWMVVGSNGRTVREDFDAIHVDTTGGGFILVRVYCGGNYPLTTRVFSPGVYVVKLRKRIAA